MVMWLVRFLIRGGTPERTRPEALDRGALVDDGLNDPQLVRPQLVRRLGVGDRRVEQLQDVPRDGPRRVVQDRPRLLDLLAADVAHPTRRALRGALRTYLERARTISSPSGRAAAARLG